MKTGVPLVELWQLHQQERSLVTAGQRRQSLPELAARRSRCPSCHAFMERFTGYLDALTI